MNTILVTGSVRHLTTNNKNLYDLYIWGSREGEQIQLIRPIELQVDGYNDMWREAKKIAGKYFKDEKFIDGAYTQFLDHIIQKVN